MWESDAKHRLDPLLDELRLRQSRRGDVAVRAHEPAESELHAAEVAHDNGEDVDKSGRFELLKNGKPGRTPRLPGVVGAGHDLGCLGDSDRQSRHG